VVDEHILIIPAIGLLEVIHAVEATPDVYTVLKSRGGEGQHIELCVSVDTDYKFTMEWFQNDAATLNTRAREALHILTGGQMFLTGPVAFTDLPSETVFQLVSQLSRKE
jgi:hypothetical protein